MTVRAPIAPGKVSGQRDVPRHIARPEYVGKPAPARFGGSEVKTPELIERMRVACRLAADALVLAGEHVKPGVTTDHIDEVVHEYLCDHGAYPSTLGYRGFPKACCTSLNEVICHGIPDSTVIEDGDIVNVDITAYIEGVHGDNNATFLAGEVSEEARLLVERTYTATMRGIKAVAPGRMLNTVGRVIEAYAKRFGYGVVRDFTGHGIGETFHSGLYVPHYDKPDLDVVMEPGMTFTIEPMIDLGTHDYDIWDDTWTVVTKDRKWSAQFEHTILVTETGHEILTMPTEGPSAGTPVPA
ncbi:type I methionyl aminopeptidase [Phytomonospora sp. NPDC050363]|uniref:type I methionyl aminopeptidase n=1 Tax=Phytomonospora sp. NPDC050363 TaxID=3155642 RepID=UPI0033F31BE1